MRYITRLLRMIAYHLPSPELVERVRPWLTLISLVLGGAFGLYQYWGQVHNAKIERTLAFVEQYRTVREENRSIQSSLDMLLEDARDIVVTTTNNYHEEKGVKKGNLNEEQRTKLRQKINSKVAQYADKKTNRDDVLRTLDFFTSVVICVRSGACDDDISIDFFGKPMFEFVNNFCPFLQNPYAQDWNYNKFGDDIFWFLFDRGYHWNVPKCGNQWYLCEKYRIIERKSWMEWFRRQYKEPKPCPS